MKENGNIILQFKNISKTFTGVKALTEVNFGIEKGEIHALIGENGAGKSTLLNIMQGVFPPDTGGELIYKGSPIIIKNPNVANKVGINMVHQELNLVSDLTVGQNIFLGCEPLTSGKLTIDWKEVYKRSDEILKVLECDIQSNEYVKNLSTAQMQMVEIAKALMHKSSVLAMDEPTASLSNSETKTLLELLVKLKKEGTSIIYVSHRLEEIFQIADKVTVLRDGQFIGTYNIQDIDKPMLIRLMVGRDIAEFNQHSQSYVVDEKVIEVKNLNSNKFKNINFSLKKGEILGISGLVGSGRTELVRAIFGADKFESGDIYVYGKKVKIKSPKNAIKRGIALIPEERKLQGMIGIMPNTFNVCISSLKKFSNRGIISHKKKLDNTKRYIDTLQISPPSAETHTRNLSGGNQQKVVLAKWLSVDSDILIFDEPTRGIDVGAKAEIYKLMDSFVKNGKSIIMISSDLPEIIGMSDRVLVMHEGKINGELSREELSEVRILHHAMGGY